MDISATQLFGHRSQIFTCQQIDDIVKVFDLLPDQVNADSAVRAYTNGIDRKHFLYPWLTKQIGSTIEKSTGLSCKIHVAMYLKEFVPWSVHSDYAKGDDHPGYAFLIPIAWDGPENSHTHTVIFNERSKTTAEHYVNSSHPKNPNALDLHDSLCSHINPHMLEYLTLALVAKWAKGDLIYWHRELLHASDNFLANGITKKRAVVIFAE